MKRKVIIVTDGDDVAKKVVEKAAANIGGRFISMSAGNPTPLSGSRIVEAIKKAEHDPVVVLVDDCGEPGKGKGEMVIKSIAEEKDIEILGVVAVASNMLESESVEVDFSINANGQVVKNAVDKYGENKDGTKIQGDTLSILKELNIPVIVGLGDAGKMHCRDDAEKGAPITTKALKEILKHNGIN